jgi:hypothetical protein
VQCNVIELTGSYVKERKKKERERKEEQQNFFPFLSAKVTSVEIYNRIK